MTNEHVDFNTLAISLMGVFFYYCLPFRKKVIQKNIDIVYKDMITHEHKKRLILAFYSHFARSVKELILLGWLGPKRLEKKITLLGVEHYLAAAKQQKGVLLLVGHLGNWELSVNALPKIKAIHEQFCIIRRPISMKWLEHNILQRHKKYGLHVIMKNGALKHIKMALKKSQAIVFALDQHADIHRADGVAVDFFGTKAGTYISLAVTARQTSAPVVPLHSYRRPDGVHVIQFFPPLEYQHHQNSRQEIYENTLTYNQMLEKMILAHPEQWYCWVHRRWKLPLLPANLPQKSS